MRYYCRRCDAELTPVHHDTDFMLLKGGEPCPFCGYSLKVEDVIPSPETVDHWEARRQECYPDSAPVYQYNSFWHRWELRDKCRANLLGVCVVATEKGDPPDDWRPSSPDPVSEEAK